jgi:hypothetical protein
MLLPSPPEHWNFRYAPSHPGVLDRYLWLMLVILATWETEVKRIVVQGQPWANSLQELISKITKAKWTGGVTLMVEYLLCKCRALNSNPSSPF